MNNNSNGVGGDFSFPLFVNKSKIKKFDFKSAQGGSKSVQNIDKKQELTTFCKLFNKKNIPVETDTKRNALQKADCPTDRNVNKHQTTISNFFSKTLKTDTKLPVENNLLVGNDDDDDFLFSRSVNTSKIKKFDFKKVKEEARLASKNTTSVQSNTNKLVISDKNIEEQRAKKFPLKTPTNAEINKKPVEVQTKNEIQENYTEKKLFAGKVDDFVLSRSINTSKVKKFDFKRIKEGVRSATENIEEQKVKKISLKTAIDNRNIKTESAIVQSNKIDTNRLCNESEKATKSSNNLSSIDSQMEYDEKQESPSLNNEVDYLKESFQESSAKSESSSVFDNEFDIDDIDWNSDVFADESNVTQEPSTHFPQRKDDSAEFKQNYPHTPVMNEVLHEKFGLTSYRPLQEEIINASLTQHDCFVLMPTGGGKSLCYQLPAILTPGLTIVISPLRALISDQVDKLNALDIPAAHLCSDVKEKEANVILSKLHTREPLIKLLYLTPEKIVASKNVCDLLNTLYRRGKLARFVIDEVHCLSQWGHDFRPDYKKLSELRTLYPEVPIMCLTATATRTVQNDVLNILRLNNVKTFIRGFNRPNIKYQVLTKTSRFMIDEISELIKKKFFKKSGIIYCLCRTDCEKLAKELCKHGIRARPYHAGMSDSAREKEQRGWMQDQFHVIVATIAFGMGIDKPDVRYVIHVSIPKSVEAFYQESGRAGRDGEPSYSYLYYSYGDVGRLQRLMRLDRSNNQRSLEGHFDGLQKMAVYCENKVDCRRYLQLLHLGETFDRKTCMNDPVTICDNCENLKNYETLDVTDRAKELTQIVEDLALRQNVTMTHVADVYKGSKLKKVVTLGHDKHPLYAKGSELRKSDIHRILKELIFRKILIDHCQFTGEFPIVYIKPGPKLRAIKENSEKLVIAVEKASATKTTATATTKTTSANNYTQLPQSPNNNTYRITSLKVKCHEELLEVCQKLAEERCVTLSSIMNLSAVKKMADVLPTSEAEFLNIQHVTQANYTKFGSHFLKITQKYKKLIAPLEKPVTPSTMDDSFDADFQDWCERAGPSGQGQKRKATGKPQKRTTKKAKKSYGRKKWKGKRTKKTPAKARAKKGKVGLMPVIHIS